MDRGKFLFFVFVVLILLSATLSLAKSQEGKVLPKKKHRELQSKEDRIIDSMRWVNRENEKLIGTGKIGHDHKHHEILDWGLAHTPSARAWRKKHSDLYPSGNK